MTAKSFITASATLPVTTTGNVPTQGRGPRHRLLDPTLFADSRAAATFLGNLLEASTEYSIIGEDLDGKIELWNEGARRNYGYEPEEVIGKANASILTTVEDVAAGLPLLMTATALKDGKYEGTV